MNVTVRWKLMLGTAVLLAVPTIGSAASWMAESPHPLATPLGEYVLVGGGVNDFAKSDVGDRFNVGGTWNVRFGIGSRSLIGAEVAYVGSRRNGKGATNDLMANGAEGVLRLQYPYVTRSRWLLEPFAFGGIGWSHLSLENAPAGVKSSDDIGVIPVGGGLTLGYGRLLVDARFSYNSTFNEDLALSTTGRTGDLQNWAVLGSIGYEF